MRHPFPFSSSFSPSRALTVPHTHRLPFTSLVVVPDEEQHEEQDELADDLALLLPLSDSIDCALGSDGTLGTVPSPPPSEREQRLPAGAWIRRSSPPRPSSFPLSFRMPRADPLPRLRSAPHLPPPTPHQPSPLLLPLRSTWQPIAEPRALALELGEGFLSGGMKPLMEVMSDEEDGEHVIRWKEGARELRGALLEDEKEEEEEERVRVRLDEEEEEEEEEGLLQPRRDRVELVQAEEEQETDDAEEQEGQRRRKVPATSSFSIPPTTNNSIPHQPTLVIAVAPPPAPSPPPPVGSEPKSCDSAPGWLERNGAAAFVREREGSSMECEEEEEEGFVYPEGFEAGDDELESEVEEEMDEMQVEPVVVVVPQRIDKTRPTPLETGVAPQDHLEAASSSWNNHSALTAFLKSRGRSPPPPQPLALAPSTNISSSTIARPPPQLQQQPLLDRSKIPFLSSPPRWLTRPSSPTAGESTYIYRLLISPSLLQLRAHLTALGDPGFGLKLVDRPSLVGEGEGEGEAHLLVDERTVVLFLPGGVRRIVGRVIKKQGKGKRGTVQEKLESLAEAGVGRVLLVLEEEEGEIVTTTTTTSHKTTKPQIYTPPVLAALEQLEQLVADCRSAEMEVQVVLSRDPGQSAEVVRRLVGFLREETAGGGGETWEGGRGWLSEDPSEVSSGRRLSLSPRARRTELMGDGTTRVGRNCPPTTRGAQPSDGHVDPLALW